MESRKRKKFLILCLPVFLAMLFMSSSALAEDKTKLGEVVVTATRIEESVKEATSDVVVIKNEDIKKMNVEFVTDVLRNIPELNLVQNGGAGKNASVVLRGGDSKHAMVMIDGVKIKSTTTGSVDFSGISVDDIERIEIVKGPQSTLYGSEAMAGVINVITKKGEGKAKINTSFETGSYGTYKPSFTVSGGTKKLDYRLTGNYFYSDGISAAKAGTERDGYENAGVSAKVGINPAEKLDFEISGKYYYDRSELDGFNYAQRKAVDDTNYVQYGHHHILSGKGRLYLFNIWEQILTLSTVKDSLKSRDPDTSFNNYDIITGVDSADWQHNIYAADFYTVTAGVEYREEKGESKGNFDRAIDNEAFYLNNKLKLFKDNLILNAGLRYDDHEISGSKTTYKAGALYDIKPAGLKVRASYATGFRSPTFNEMFYPGYGALTLKPEETTSWEAGIEKDIVKDKAIISVTYFDQEYRNLIETDPLTWLAANIAKAEVKGIETDMTLKLIKDLSLKAGYTYLDAKDKSTGQKLTRRPQDKFTLTAGYAFKDLSLTAGYIFVSERYDSSVRRNLASYSLVNLSADYKVAKWMALFARADNLFNEDYEEAGSYKTPGFSVFGGVKLASF